MVTARTETFVLPEENCMLASKKSATCNFRQVLHRAELLSEENEWNADIRCTAPS
jgi:hypothetical protein